jgi:tetratricopeptide (TPR) repeat protein
MSLERAQAMRLEGKHEEARSLLTRLAAAFPDNATIQYEAACVHDSLGDEAAAVSYYVRALAGRLRTDEERIGAFLGLGSTYRALGRYAEADETLSDGIREFPEASELRVFLAMVQYNIGQSKLSVQTLLSLLASTSQDPRILAYARAIRLYAEDIDRVWKY